MKYLSRTLPAVLTIMGLAFFLSASPLVASGASDTPATRYITLSADGTVKVTPDAVLINATVSVVGASTADALSATSTTSSAVRQALKANGVAIKDIATQSITVYPEYDYSNTISKLIGYRASQSFIITVHNASFAGALVDAIVTTGGNNIQVNSVAPYISSSEASLEGARTMAVKAATVKAKSYAKLLGVTLGKINYLVENSGSAPTPYPIYATASKDASTPTQVDLGQQLVTVNVTVQWSLL